MLLPLGITPAHAELTAALQLAQGPRPGPRAAGARRGRAQSPGGAKSPAGNAAGNSQIDREIAISEAAEDHAQQEPHFNAFAEIIAQRAGDGRQMSQGTRTRPHAVEALSGNSQLTKPSGGLEALVPALQSALRRASTRREIGRQGDRRRRRAGPGPQRGGRMIKSISLLTAGPS